MQVDPLQVARQAFLGSPVVPCQPSDVPMPDPAPGRAPEQRMPIRRLGACHPTTTSALAVKELLAGGSRVDHVPRGNPRRQQTN